MDGARVHAILALTLAPRLRRCAWHTRDNAGSAGQASNNGVSLGSLIVGIDPVKLPNAKFDVIVHNIRQLPRPLSLELWRPRYRFHERSPAYAAPCLRLWAGEVRVMRHSGDPPLDRAGRAALESVFISTGGGVRAHMIAFLESSARARGGSDTGSRADDAQSMTSSPASAHTPRKPYHWFGVRVDSDARPVPGHVDCVQITGVAYSTSSTPSGEPGRFRLQCPRSVPCCRCAGAAWGGAVAY